MEENQVTTEEHLFNDYVEVRKASTGQRFVNFLVDNLIMSLGLNYVSGIAVGYLIATFFPDYALRISYEKETGDLLIIGYAIVILNDLAYYIVCEKVFRGYTVGKLISGSRAIRLDGKELTFKDAFLRTVCRFVPFETLSGFGTPWHDSWTKTQVIKTR